MTCAGALMFLLFNQPPTIMARSQIHAMEWVSGDDRIAFKYVDTPNGAMDDIAGILSANKRVLGMMPHPERLNDPQLGGTDGVRFFEGIANALVSA